jgi:hypothetical protein
MITTKQVDYINSLLDRIAARSESAADRAVTAFNEITGRDEGNIGSAKGSGTGLRKRLGRITRQQASELIDTLKAI